MPGVPHTVTLCLPILVNTLPVFCDNIAEAICPDYRRVLGANATSLASGHGGERVRTTNYDGCRTGNGTRFLTMGTAPRPDSSVLH